MRLKVISLNLWHGGRLLEAALDFLKQQDADVVALQEVFNGQDPAYEPRYRSMAVLKQRLQYEYQTFAEAFTFQENDLYVPMGNAILSKHPITHETIRFFVEAGKPFYEDVPENWPLEPRLLQGVKLPVNNHEVNFFNMQGVWDLDGDNASPARQKMVDTILECTAGLPNVIFTGDTNAKPINPAMRRLDASLKNVFDDNLKSTFNMQRKTNPGYATAAVDLMYVSPNVKVLSKTCPAVDISDHLPIVVELEI